MTEYTCPPDCCDESEQAKCRHPDWTDALRCVDCGEPMTFANCGPFDPDRMTAAPTTRTADDVFERPPWCGTCDEWTRKVEVEIDGRDAMQNCTRCHPLAVAS